MPNLPLCHWSSQSSQLSNLHAPLLTDDPVLLLNQPNNIFFLYGGNDNVVNNQESEMKVTIKKKTKANAIWKIQRENKMYYCRLPSGLGWALGCFFSFEI